MTTSSLHNHYSYNNNHNSNSYSNDTGLFDDDRPLTPAGTLTSVEQEVLDSQLRIAHPVSAAAVGVMPPRDVLVPYDHHHHTGNNNYYYNYNNNEATTDEEQGDFELVYHGGDEAGVHNNASSLLAQDLGFTFRRPPPPMLANPRAGRTAGRFSLDD